MKQKIKTGEISSKEAKKYISGHIGYIQSAGDVVGICGLMKGDYIEVEEIEIIA